MIGIYLNKNLIALDTNNNNLHSDFLINSKSIRKLNLEKNVRFYFNALIDTSFVKHVFEFHKRYLINGEYEKINLTAQFTGSNLEFIKYIEINNCKRFSLLMFSILNR